MIEIDEKALAKLLQVTDRWVRDIFEEFEISPKVYDLIKCIQKFISNTKNETGTYVNLKTLADILGLTERTVRNLTERRILVKNDQDKYELKENLKSYLKDNSEKAKKEKAQRKMAELRYEVYTDKFHEDEVVEFILSEMILKFKAKLLAAVRKMANEIENNPNMDKVEILEKHILAALTELSDYDPPSNMAELKKELE
ncbi:hypothetical protein [Fusobacterium ulcerans]|uniref:hypothetical protein n=1 Tax=Fusobacterium ulcerans TaxID=861 RepID=UPI0026DCE49F|nr:hypothetical protein [Fusobacterium ulcerans]